MLSGRIAKKLTNIFICATLSTAIIGCASVPPKAPKPAQEEAETFQAPKGKSRIYVIFPSSEEGSTRKAFLFDGKWSTYLTEGTYWMKNVEPGEHTLADDGGILLDGIELTIETDPDEIIFFQLGTVDAILSDIAKFNIINEKSGKAMVKKYYRVKPSEQ